MRLIDILSPSVSLFERTIVNIDDMRKVVDDLADVYFSFAPEAQTWFKSQLFKYLANKETHHSLMHPAKADHANIAALPSIPPWMAADIEKGEAYWFNVYGTGGLDREAMIVADWFVEQHDQGRNPLRRGMTWEQARDAAIRDKAKADERREIQRSEDAGTFIVKGYSDGFYWVRIENDDCLNREGERMANCLKNASMDDDSDGHYYSLRDDNDRPQVTMSTKYKDHDMDWDEELDDWIEMGGEDYVDDLQGFANEKPKEMFYSYIADLIATLGLNPIYSNSAVDILMKSGYIVDEESGKVQSINDFKGSGWKVMDTSTGKEWWGAKEKVYFETGTEERIVYFLFDGGNTMLRIKRGLDVNEGRITGMKPYMPDTGSWRVVMERVGEDLAELINKENLMMTQRFYDTYELMDFGISVNHVYGRKE